MTLLACLLLTLSFALRAQDGTHPSLADLATHRNQWPRQVTLKTDVQMSMVSNGKVVGSMPSPAGTTVDLVSVDATSLQIKVLSMQASVAPEQTDLWERIAVAAKPVAAATTPALSTPPPPAVAPAPTAPAATPAAAPSAKTDAGPPITLDYEVPAQDTFTKAAFRFWSPAYTQPTRGVIVLVPGLDGDGRSMLNGIAWQNLARKYRLALVSCFMQGKDYYNAPRGTGDALLEALKNFADRSGHAEVATAPLLLYGESAGGQFDYDFVLWKPERVMAFVVNKGGYYNGGEPDSRTCATPGLFFLGKSDTDLRINAITTIWTAGRHLGALWALAPQPNSGHEFSRTPPVAQAFFEGVLKARLADDSLSSDGPPPMKSMQESQGWLGDLTTFEIHDGSTDAQPDHKAAWLPDQNSATVWKAFVSH
jgi:hypothetical protein